MRSLYLSELKKDSLALRDLQTAAQLRPDNDTYLERLAQFYLGMQDYAKATDAYERLYATHDDRTDVLNILIQLYQQSKNYDGMLRCINRIGQVEGETEAITMSKMRVYELKGDKKNALRTLKELAKEHANDLNYKIMMGNWLMQHQRQKEAFDLFTEALKEEPDNSYAQGSMYDYYRANGMKQQAADMRDRILLSDKTPLQTKMVVVRQVIADNEAVRGDSTEVLTLLDESLAQGCRCGKPEGGLYAVEEDAKDGSRLCFASFAGAVARQCRCPAAAGSECPSGQHRLALAQAAV